MSTMGRRLAALRNEADLTQEEVGLALGVVPSTISWWERDKSPEGMNTATLQKIADFYAERLNRNVTIGFLLTGQEEPKAAQNLASEGLRLPANALSLGLTTKIKILGKVVAGEPAGAEQIVLGEEEIPMADVTGECFLLKVSGDSMAPTIQDGGLVFVVRQPTVEDGEVAVVMFADESEGTLKRIRRMNGKILLIPDNADYSPISADPSQIQVVGRAMWVRYDIGKKRMA